MFIYLLHYVFTLYVILLTESPWGGFVLSALKKHCLIIVPIENMKIVVSVRYTVSHQYIYTITHTHTLITHTPTSAPYLHQAHIHQSHMHNINQYKEEDAR